MKVALFLIAIAFIIAATYANLKKEHKLGVILSGIAGGLAVWLLFYGKLNPVVTFAIGFVLTAAFEWARFFQGKR
ncbi:hypothetical protein [Thermococcus sp. AM4]|uniref:hypothetical protein n=1 Tax=Thermococcus sp. (strain AM4) TaxID=246969 RepID=UPI0001870CD1|nr:hypothetical protein [Thermococcus sp. AM4]EEB74347.1 conserved hypothetical protein [Thermococcus sp. AM4]